MVLIRWAHSRCCISLLKLLSMLVLSVETFPVPFACGTFPSLCVLFACYSAISVWFGRSTLNLNLIGFNLIHWKLLLTRLFPDMLLVFVLSECPSKYFKEFFWCSWSLNLVDQTKWVSVVVSSIGSRNRTNNIKGKSILDYHRNHDSWVSNRLQISSNVKCCKILEFISPPQQVPDQNNQLPNVTIN